MSRLAGEGMRKTDAEIIKILRTNNPSPDDDIAALIAEAESLKKTLEEAGAEVEVK